MLLENLCMFAVHLYWSVASQEYFGCDGAMLTTCKDASHSWCNPMCLMPACHACQGGLRPHAFCLPILKREEHRAAVLAAATSGSPKFFLGTDSAPHPRSAKVSPCTTDYHPNLHEGSDD